MGVRHPPGSALQESTLGLIDHVTRRQATYVWRRRIPTAAGAVA